MANPNPDARRTAELAQRLAGGYYSHTALLEIAKNPEIFSLSPTRNPGHLVPVGHVYRRDGSFHTYHFTHFLDWVRDTSLIGNELERVWLVGALIQLGDELSRHDYFDRAPELEMIRHLRNGVAHGNRFHISRPEILSRFPAHTKLSWVRKEEIFEISPDLNNQTILFDYMGPGDIIDLFQSVGVYLWRMGNGEDLRPPILHRSHD